ncbi:MAG: hypothetical protein AB1705_22450 [Verrucomicrobiota bacterium]
MNEAIPPAIPTAAVATEARPGLWSPAPLGSVPEEKEPIDGAISAFEAILRQPRRVMYQLFDPAGRNTRAALLLITILLALIYGFVVGTFSGGDQYWAAPVKVAAGLMLSALICLPSLYIFSCLSGAHARLADVWGLVAGLIALMMILLIGFAPVAWVFSQSTESATFMGFLHLMFWMIAVYFGVGFLKAGFAHLRSNSEGGVNTWVVIFLLVMLQMTCALRPLIGTAPTMLPTEKKFFVGHWLDNLKGERSGEYGGKR